jgi:hypothetical protein
VKIAENAKVMSPALLSETPMGLTL